MKKHRKIIYSLVVTAAIASASATYHFNQISNQADQKSQAISQQPIPQSQNPTTSAQCDPALWKYVYHPQRLPTKNDCRTVSGTVMWVKHEPDGDYHIRLAEDYVGKGNRIMPSVAPVNAKNISGYLVVEPICQTAGMPKPTQADAVQGCAQYVKDNQPQFPMPTIGQHITVTGFYTQDLQHSWMEIHSAIIK